MAAVDKVRNQPVNFCPLIFSQTSARDCFESAVERVRFSLAGGIPPPPLPLKGLLGAGFARMVCKILSRKDLEVKI